MTDNVNHPAHYTAGNIECIDAIKEAVKGLEGIEAVITGKVIKYMWRWKRKNGLEDLKKAQWYLERLIKEHGQANQTLPHKEIREEAPNGNSSVRSAHR